MDLDAYRSSTSEQTRTADILRLLPESGAAVLDVGAREGYFSKMLAQRFESVVALDLEEPKIEGPRITCVRGDVTSLEFTDKSFDLVLCTEVLEHIPPSKLQSACSELSRVAHHQLLIGVPYKQDLRIGRTTCRTCGKANPPWGHVNSFDEDRLIRLFPTCDVREVSLVGSAKGSSNFVSTYLMDLAGNPYGTYSQEEPCIHCGTKLAPAKTRSFAQKIATRMAYYAKKPQTFLERSHANWIHILFEKRTAS